MRALEGRWFNSTSLGRMVAIGGALIGALGGSFTASGQTATTAATTTGAASTTTATAATTTTVATTTVTAPAATPPPASAGTAPATPTIPPAPAYPSPCGFSVDHTKPVTINYTYMPGTDKSGGQVTIGNGTAAGPLTISGSKTAPHVYKTVSVKIHFVTTTVPIPDQTVAGITWDDKAKQYVIPAAVPKAQQTTFSDARKAAQDKANTSAAQSTRAKKDADAAKEAAAKDLANNDHTIKALAARVAALEAASEAAADQAALEQATKTDAAAGEGTLAPLAANLVKAINESSAFALYKDVPEAINATLTITPDPKGVPSGVAAQDCPVQDYVVFTLKEPLPPPPSGPK